MADHENNSLPDELDGLLDEILFGDTKETEETVPEKTGAEETVPEETVPEETVPEETVPEEAGAEETVPEETETEETVAEESISEDVEPGETLEDAEHFDVDSFNRQAVEQAKKEKDDLNLSLDDIEFISLDTVKDKTKMTKSSDVSADSTKKTNRRAADVQEDKRQGHRSFWRRHIGLLVFLIVLVVAALAALGYFGKQYLDEKKAKAEANKELPLSTQEYEKDAYSEINTLVNNYYDAYANGDTDTILQYAYPMTDKEKSYIQMYASYIQGYENIVCYTKTGLDDESYIVSVAFDLRYKEIAETAPGLDFFYVRTADNGSLYIDNVYSPFNLLYQENAMDPDILQLITDYQNGDDVTDLQAGVQVQYDDVVASDEELAEMVNVTIPAAVAAWDAEQAQLAQDSQDAASAQVAEDTKTQEAEEAAAQKAAEEQAKEEEIGETEDRKTVYVTETVFIRETPDENGSKLASVKKGSEIRQIATTKVGWIKVYTGEVVGYISAEYISETAPEDSSSETTSSGTGSVSAGDSVTLSDSVNIRKSMNVSDNILGLAYPGDTLTIVQVYENGWCKVEWNGETGYIKTEVLPGM